MKKELWFGPVLNEHRDELINRCAGRVNNDQADTFLYLAASRPLLDKSINSILDRADGRATWGAPNVFLFRGLVQRIISRAQTADQKFFPQRVRIDTGESAIRHSLVALILRELAENGSLTAITSLVGRDGCVSTVERLLGEIERAGITPKEFRNIAERRASDLSKAGGLEGAVSVPSSASQADFDRDLAAIYDRYHLCLEDFHLTEADADQLRALEILSGEVSGKVVHVPWLDKIDLLIVDGFYDFTPIQGLILRQLIRLIPHVIVNLNADDQNPEVFRPYEETIKMFEGLADFERVVRTRVAENPSGLSSLRTRLFNPDITEPAVFDAELEEAKVVLAAGIKIIHCANPEIEIREIAREIKRLVLGEHYALPEIAVVFRQSSQYLDTVSRVFELEGVPCDRGHLISAFETSPVRSALKLFEMLSDLGTRPASELKMSLVSSLVKTGGFDFDSVDPVVANNGEGENSRAGSSKADFNDDEFENAIAFVGQDLNAIAWLDRAEILLAARSQPPFEIDSGQDTDEEDVASFHDAEPDVQPKTRSETKASTDDSTLARSINRVRSIVAILDATDRVGTFLSLRELVPRLLANLGFRDIKTRGAGREDDFSKEEALALDFRAFEALAQALDAASECYRVISSNAESSPGIPLREYLQTVQECLRNTSIEVTSEARRGVPILAATDIRGLRFRAIFIGGLVEGAFPLRPRRDWIYPHEERERLKQYGLTLEDTSPNSLLKEEHYFYQVACRATERLYLTLPKVLADGAETIESYYLNELRHALLPETIETATVRASNNADSLYSSSTSTSLVLALWQTRRDPKTSDGRFVSNRFIDRAEDWARGTGLISDWSDHRISVGRERSSNSFGRFDGRITQPALIEMMRERFGAEHIFSASQFGLYGKSPFKFLAQRVLKLEARGEAATDLSALDSGSMVHRILQLFFESHRGEDLTVLDRKQMSTEIRKIGDDVFDQFEARIPPLVPAVWHLEREIMKIILDNLLLDEIDFHERITGSAVRAKYFELGFGHTGPDLDPDSTPSCLVLDTDLSDDDRILISGKIDRVDEDADGTLIAYDYKMTTGARLDDMSAGRELQMGIYLSALEQVLKPDATIAGGGYYIVKPSTSARRNQGLYRARFSSQTGIGDKAVSNLEDDAWFELRDIMMGRIREFRDLMRTARFDVAPTAWQKTCKNCEYRKLCRFEPYRIRQKMRAEQT